MKLKIPEVNFYWDLTIIIRKLYFIFQLKKQQPTNIYFHVNKKSVNLNENNLLV